MGLPRTQLGKVERGLSDIFFFLVGCQTWQKLLDSSVLWKPYVKCPGPVSFVNATCVNRHSILLTLGDRGCLEQNMGWSVYTIQHDHWGSFFCLGIIHSQYLWLYAYICLCCHCCPGKQQTVLIRNIYICIWTFCCLGRSQLFATSFCYF